MLSEGKLDLQWWLVNLSYGRDEAFFSEGTGSKNLLGPIDVTPQCLDPSMLGGVL
jgi:hypothetical protein